MHFGDKNAELLRKWDAKNVLKYYSLSSQTVRVKGP